MDNASLHAGEEERQPAHLNEKEKGGRELESPMHHLQTPKMWGGMSNSSLLNKGGNMLGVDGRSRRKQNLITGPTMFL